MTSTLCFLLPLVILAVALDIFLVKGLQRFHRLKKESMDQDGTLKISKRELLGRAFFNIAEGRDTSSTAGNMPKLSLRAAIPIVSILLILAGIIQLRAETWAAGSICIILALIGFTPGIRSLENTTLPTKEIEVPRPLAVPTILWIVIPSLLIISVFLVADDFKSAGTDRVAAAAWLCAILLSLIVTWRPANRILSTGAFAALREKIDAIRMELILLSLVLGMAFLMRTLNLSTHPYPWSGDEASIGIEARRILSGEVTNFFEAGWSSQPNWSFVPTAITEIIFGQNILAVRLTSALAGTLAVLFVYLTARVLFNPTIGLMSGAFLATLPYNVHFSRIGVNNVMDSFMSALLFWLITKALQKDDRRYYYSAGIVGGLCIYTYAGTRLALIMGAFIFLFVIVGQDGYLRSHWKHLIAFIFGIVVSIAPQATYFAQHRNIFLGRLAQEGILFNGWLARRAIETGQTYVDVLIDQFTRTTMVFIASPAPSNFFNSPDPYLTIIASTLFLLGMWYSLAFLFETRYFILLVWFWAVILFGGILTLNPPANTRMLMTSPPVAIFMAIGTYKVVEYLQKFRILPERAVLHIFFAVTFIITYQNIKFYMIEYKTNMYFEDANSEFAMETGLMAKDLGEVYTLYFLGAPRVFSGFPTIPFLAPQNRRADLTAESSATLTLATDQRVAFFAIPENRFLLEEISQEFPGGERGLIYRKTGPGEILFEYYILTP
jgi:4-amino-4-deoxy-L-arabinose transferase-like glycosyltransferase